MGPERERDRVGTGHQIVQVHTVPEFVGAGTVPANVPVTRTSRKLSR